MKILLLLSHSIEEYDQVKLLAGLGHDIFSIGAYTNPAVPGDDARPALPDVPYHPELEALCVEQRERHAADDARSVIDWAKGDLHPTLIDWADAIIIHHFERAWIGGNWPRIRDKRVIWRTVGQSMPANELAMAPLRRQGLQIVRYSPKERNLPTYAGEDALIRFYKDPDEWSGWTGTDPVVLNITQQLMQRGDATNGDFYMAATEGLPRRLVGDGSEAYGGPGRVSYTEMQAELRRARCYLYTGTQPASYTLGLIEAMMTGVPVVSIGPAWHTWSASFGGLFEGPELASFATSEPTTARARLRTLLADDALAADFANEQRQRAIYTFGLATVAAAWREFLA